MARYPTWATFVVVAALVIGCGPEKELPTDAPKVGGPVVVQQIVPQKSEPEAKAVVERAVKALTGGKPELFLKGKYCRCVMKGQMFSIAQPDQQNDANRTVTTVWPDRFFSANEWFAMGNRVLDEVWLRRPGLVIANNGVSVPIANVELAERSLMTDFVGQNWMPLLLPAADPKAVLFDLQTVTLDRRDLRVLSLSLGEYPIYDLTFDATTNALVRAEYTISQVGAPRRTMVVFSDHKPGPDGFVLPHRIECRHNGNVVEKLTVEKWELPATIPDDEFSPPRKK